MKKIFFTLMIGILFLSGCTFQQRMLKASCESGINSEDCLYFAETIMNRDNDLTTEQREQVYKYYTLRGCSGGSTHSCRAFRDKLLVKCTNPDKVYMCDFNELEGKTTYRYE